MSCFVSDQWRDKPIFVTAYSYFFGALFMGLASVYYVATKQFEAFKVEDKVSQGILERARKRVDDITFFFL